jgi:hypothetical protein
VADQVDVAQVIGVLMRRLNRTEIELSPRELESVSDRALCFAPGRAPGSLLVLLEDAAPTPSPDPEERPMRNLATLLTPHEFAGAHPFPHAVLDRLWDPNWLSAMAAEFPATDDPRWSTYPDPKEWGKRAGDARCWGPATRRWFEYIASDEVCEALAAATGIGPLTADTVGGGMHMTSEGGRLDSHVDFNLHPDNPGWERRLNLLVFLNHDWRAEWGGVLYLGEHREVAVLPEFNRTVLFATSDESWHGHPDPIVGDHHRKSLAAYFYAPVRETTGPAHSTVWQAEANA